MGQQQSTFGGVFLNFDKPYYYPGDLVTGNVYINMLNAFDTKGIELNVEVVEHTSFYHSAGIIGDETKHYTPNTTYTRQEVMSHQRELVGRDDNNGQTIVNSTATKILRQSTSTLYRTSNLLNTWSGNRINIGQYAFPVKFGIPSNLPGSFEYYDGDSSAYVKYIVTVKAYSRSGTNDMVYSTILIVRQPQQFFSYPNNLTDTRSITEWCFFNKGSSTLNVSYPKNFYVPGETVQVICNLNNTNCQLNATRFKLQLIQRIHLKVNDDRMRNLYINRIITESIVDGHYVIDS
jgi:hypothetical protein